MDEQLEARMKELEAKKKKERKKERERKSKLQKRIALGLHTGDSDAHVTEGQDEDLFSISSIVRSRDHLLDAKTPELVDSEESSEGMLNHLINC